MVRYSFLAGQGSSTHNAPQHHAELFDEEMITLWCCQKLGHASLVRHPKHVLAHPSWLKAKRFARMVVLRQGSNTAKCTPWLCRTFCWWSIHTEGGQALQSLSGESAAGNASRQKELLFSICRHLVSSPSGSSYQRWDKSMTAFTFARKRVETGKDTTPWWGATKVEGNYTILCSCFF